MPSPALQKLDALPLTPLQSAPNSAGSSRPSSRRGSTTMAAGNPATSSSLASLRKQSMGSHSAIPPTSALTALSSRKNSTKSPTSADGILPTAGSSSLSNTASTSAIEGQSSNTDAATTDRKRKESEEAIEQAVVEEQMLPEASPVTAPSGNPHAESALDDDSNDEDDDNDEADVPEGVLRTGNQRFRTGSRRLSRMSSTLGEGITAHWKRSTPPVTKSPGQIPSSPKTGATTDSSTTAEVKAVQKAQQQVQSTPMAPSTLVSALRDRQKRSPPSENRGSSNERVKAEPSAASLPSSAIPPGSPLHKSKDFARASGSSPPPLPKLPPIEHAKRLAAYRAVDVHVKPHHRVIGIGSGSTVPYVVDRLLEQGEEANRRRWFVPTGFQSKELIVNAGLKLGDVDQFPGIDVTIDGADDVDFALNAIKGGGACHLREKVLAEAAEEFIIVADYRKDNMLLGQSWKQGIPIETPAFAYSKVLDNLERIPGCIDPQLRMGKAKAGPLDNGNFVIDAPFDEAHMREPESLLVKIKMLTGVVEVGLFCGMARAAYFGNPDGSVTVRWSDGQTETLKEGEEAKIKADNIDENTRPTDILLTWQPPSASLDETDSAKTKVDPTDMSKLKAKLENLRMTST